MPKEQIHHEAKLAPWLDPQNYPLVPEAYRNNFGILRGRWRFRIGSLRNLKLWLSTDLLHSIRFVWSPGSIRMMPPVLLGGLEKSAVLRWKLFSVAYFVYFVYKATQNPELLETASKMARHGLVAAFLTFELWRLQSGKRWAIEQRNKLMCYYAWVSLTRPWVTYALIFLILGGSLLDPIMTGEPWLQRACCSLTAPVAQFGFRWAELLDGEIWRLGTYASLHASFNHFMGNALGIGAYGWLIESMGHKRLAIVSFSVGVVVGGLFGALMDSRYGVGASAGLWSMMGVAGGELFRYRHQLALDVPLRFIGPSLIAVVLAATLSSDTINHWGHLSGLIVGLSLSAIFQSGYHRTNRPLAVFLRAFAASCTAFVMVSMLWIFYTAVELLI